ncbi:MAG: phosphodiester glycosidase family protein [Bacillota bacterium]|nr:phosphodiester glycosidase family protein [Bacillota bacterium]
MRKLKLRRKQNIQNEVTQDTYKKKGVIKHILLFLIFEIVFTCVSLPILIFYGPFENVKATITGMSWNTSTHQFIAKLFLSDIAINRIISKSFAIDPLDSGEVIQKLKFGVNHDEKIEIYNIDGGSFEGKLMLVHDPSRIKVGYSKNFPKSGETTSSIAKRNGAVAAINAGGFTDFGWTGTGGAPMGFIIHDGSVVVNRKSEKVKQDTAAFTDQMLIVGKHSVKQLIDEYGVKEGVSFGPPLIVNGERTIRRGDGGWGIAPRTAIGQRSDGTVILLVIDGRRAGSFGASLRDVQEIFMKYAAKNAVNLDGGSSTTMYFNGKVINVPADALGERAVASVFMVVPEKAGGK